MRSIKWVYLFMIALLLSSCSLFSPVTPPHTQTYLLQDPVMVTKPSLHHGKVLLVSDISAPAWLDTSQMAYQLNSDQINYFALNKWASPPSDLLLPIVVHALSVAGLYHAVVAVPFTGNYDQQLDIQLLDMQQIFIQNSSYYLLTARAQLMDKNSQKILAVKRFQIKVVSQANPQGGVLAANVAIKQWLSELIDFMKITSR